MIPFEKLVIDGFKTTSLTTINKCKITPYIADLIIKNHNTRNIVPSPARINRYAHDMYVGEFLYNGDSIRFDKNGILLDGQNRLLACIKSQTEFYADVVTGLPLEVFETIDQGRSKTSALLAYNFLKDKGFNQLQSRSLSAAVKLYLSFKYYGHIRPSTRNSGTKTKDFTSNYQEYLNQVNSPKYINDLIQRDYDDIIKHNKESECEELTWVGATKFVYERFNTDLANKYNKPALIFTLKLLSEHAIHSYIAKYFIAELGTRDLSNKYEKYSKFNHTLYHVFNRINKSALEIKPPTLILYLIDSWNSIVKGGLTSRKTENSNNGINKNKHVNDDKKHPIDIMNEEKAIVPAFFGASRSATTIAKHTNNGLDLIVSD